LPSNNFSPQSSLRFHKFSPEDKALTQRFVDIFHPLEIKVIEAAISAGDEIFGQHQGNEV